MKIAKELRQILRDFQIINKVHGKHNIKMFDKHNLDLTTKVILKLKEKSC